MSDNRGEKYTFLEFGVKKSADLQIKKVVRLILVLFGSIPNVGVIWCFASLA